MPIGEKMGRDSSDGTNHRLMGFFGVAAARDAAWHIASATFAAPSAVLQFLFVAHTTQSPSTGLVKKDCLDLQQRYGKTRVDVLTVQAHFKRSAAFENDTTNGHCMPESRVALTVVLQMATKRDAETSEPVH